MINALRIDRRAIKEKDIISELTLQTVCFFYFFIKKCNKNVILCACKKNKLILKRKIRKHKRGKFFNFSRVLISATYLFFLKRVRYLRTRRTRERTETLLIISKIWKRGGNSTRVDVSIHNFLQCQGRGRRTRRRDAAHRPSRTR